MATNPQVQGWIKAFHNPTILFWLAIWIVASFMLFRQWRHGSPWPAGAFMPF